METIESNDNKWFDLSDKLEDITLTVGKTYIIQPKKNPINCFQGETEPTKPNDGLSVHPPYQSLKLTHKTGESIFIRDEHFPSTVNYITIVEVDDGSDDEE